MSNSVSALRGFFILLAGLALLPTVLCAGEGTKASEFSSILPRNAFGLVPVAQPTVAQAAPVPEASPNILLTGVALLKGKKMAYLTVTTPGVKEPKYLSLGEAEREGAIEVMAIDLKSGEVQLKDQGRPKVVNFIKNGATTLTPASIMPSGAGAVPAVNTVKPSALTVPPNPLR